MVRYILLIGLVLGAVLLPGTGFAKDAIALASVKVSLPGSDQMFPAGPGSDAMNTNCQICHSVDMVLNQPAMPKAAWEAEVNKMRNVYKAPVPPEDVEAIVDYLARTKGPQ
jgi:cytochrome c5